MRKFVILAGFAVVAFFVIRKNAQAAYTQIPQYYETQFQNNFVQGSQDLIDISTRYEMQKPPDEAQVYIPANEPLDNWDLQGTAPAPIEPLDNWDLQGTASPSDNWSLVTNALKYLTGGNMSNASNAPLQNQNLTAFKMMIRTAEGTPDADGYRRMFGGELFDSFADHPRRIQTFKMQNGQTLRSDAAGAYQALSKTWDDFIRAVGPRDFSPASQDEFATWAIRRRGALNNVLNGEFEAAVNKVAYEWASMPNSPYGQPVVSMNDAIRLYAQNGGAFADGRTVA